MVSVFPYSNSNTTCGKGDDLGLQCAGSYGGGEDMVYELQITTAGTAIITLTATGGGNRIGWFLRTAGNCAVASPCVAMATSGTGTVASTAAELSVGTYYLIIDTQLPTSCTAFDLNITAPVPSLTTLNICSGNFAVFNSVTVGGTGSCSYQWQSSPDGTTWTDIAGETTDSYTSPPLTDTTYYRAFYSCDGTACSQAYSNVRQVNVMPLPTPIAGSNSPVCEGFDLNLTSNAWATYSWTGPNGFTSTVQNPVITAATTVNAGTYNLTVTDANGCQSATTTAVIINVNPTATTTSTNSLCFNANNGTATAIPASGTSPYTYLWSSTPAQTTQTATNLAPGTYTVTVTDDNGCSTTATATITEPTDIVATTTSIPVFCYGESTGSIDLTVSGGTPGTPSLYFFVEQQCYHRGFAQHQRRQLFSDHYRLQRL